MVVTVAPATAAGPTLVAALARLLPQLTESAPPPTHEHVRRLIGDERTVLLLAELDGEIVGCLTLVLVLVPTGLKGLIEDVVVDGSARGQGIGEMLVREALQLARARGVEFVDLTSNESREAANRLYQRIGFELRTTNVYRFVLDS